LPYPPIPETATNALLLGGSLSWAAEKGAYLVGTLGQQEIPMELNTNNGGVHGFSNSIFYASPISGVTSPLGFLANPMVTSFNPFGAYFTGLSNQTTLDVVWHYIVERFPNATNTDLVTMASNSCPFDPKALELYSRTSWHLPTGCWVEDNGLGDWICEVADVLGDFGIPGMGIVKGVTKGIQTVSNMFDEHQSGGATPTQTVEKKAKKPRKPVKRNVPTKQGPRMREGSFMSPVAKGQKRKRKAKKKKQG